MTRFLLSAVSIFVLLTTTFFLPQAVAARRCTVVMPSTLLSLYRSSDAIYIGTYDKSVEGEVTVDTPDYSVLPITKHYSISSALKGDTLKMLTLQDTEYRYKNRDEDAVEEEPEDEEAGEDDNEVRPGDQVLIFVSRDEENSDAVELTRFDAIKKMSGDKLSSYEARIRELNGIFSGDKPSHAEVVEWLIRCAEDPHTRWEGTYELLRSFQNMDWEEEREKESKQAPESEIVEDVIDPLPARAPVDFTTGDTKLARSVTDAQKDLLTNILVKRELLQEDEDKKADVSTVPGDRELIELVTRWGDPNVAAALLEQLRNRSADASFSSGLMASIASLLKDDELRDISARYSDIQWESDEDEVEAEDEEAEVGEDGEESDQPSGDIDEIETSGPQTQSEVVPVEQNEESKMDAPAPVAEKAVEGLDVVSTESGKGKKTVADLRLELLTKFLDRGDILVAAERNKENAKLNN